MSRTVFAPHLIFACLAAVALLGSAPAAARDGHVLIHAGKEAYAPGPASIPKGAEYAVLYGDPGREGLFAMRLRLPAGYHIAPHSHGQPEIVTVISGTFLIGQGEKAEKGKAEELSAGGFFAFPPGHVHFAYAGDDGAVIQLNSTGPWTIRYVDPADDPRPGN